MYSCGTYTDEPDGICGRCKGYSTVSIAIRELRNDKTLDDAVRETEKRAKNNGGKEMTSKHKKCKKDDCEKVVWKDGMCFRHYFQEHTEEKKPTKTKDNAPHPPLSLSLSLPITWASGHCGYKEMWGV
jgi:hypothetical protein